MSSSYAVVSNDINSFEHPTIDGAHKRSRELHHIQSVMMHTMKNVMTVSEALDKSLTIIAIYLDIHVHIQNEKIS